MYMYTCTKETHFYIEVSSLLGRRLASVKFEPVHGISNNVV